MTPQFRQIICCSLLFLLGCHPSSDPSPPLVSKSTPPAATPDAPLIPWFEEVASGSGFDFVHHTGHQPPFFWNPEIVAGGVGLIDFDQDGLLDIYCVQAGSLHPEVTHPPGNRLYRNLGNFRFTDVTESAQVGDRGFGMGCAVGDYDNDGDPDLYVTNMGDNVLYQNLGNGIFTNVTTLANAAGSAWGASCTFGDFNQDDYLDLFIANYFQWKPEFETPCYSRGGRQDYCSPNSFPGPLIDTLLQNLDGNRFEDVTHVLGLDVEYGNGLGVVAADFNRDGFLDYYVANDANPNQLWIHQPNGTFSNKAMLLGCAVNYLGLSEAGMGVVPVDLQPDGWIDLFMTHLQGEANRLYINRQGQFEDTVSSGGPGAVSWPNTGFGVGFGDFDHDGILDLYVSNGRVKFGPSPPDPEHPYSEFNQLSRGLPDGQFETILPQGGTNPPLLHASRGQAIGDLDNDGDLDLVVINRDGPTYLLRNITPKKGNWVQLHLLNRHGATAIGAEITLHSATYKAWRLGQPGIGYCSSQDPRIHFGLPQTVADLEIEVRWPNLTLERFGPFQPNQILDIHQGTGRSVAGAEGQP